MTQLNLLSSFFTILFITSQVNFISCASLGLQQPFLVLIASTLCSSQAISPALLNQYLTLISSKLPQCPANNQNSIPTTSISNKLSPATCNSQVCPTASTPYTTSGLPYSSKSCLPSTPCPNSVSSSVLLPEVKPSSAAFSPTSYAVTDYRAAILNLLSSVYPSGVIPSSVAAPITNTQTAQVPPVPIQTTPKAQCVSPNNNEAILKLLSPLLISGSSLNSVSLSNGNNVPSSLLTPCSTSTTMASSTLSSIYKLPSTSTTPCQKINDKEACVNLQTSLPLSYSECTSMPVKNSPLNSVSSSDTSKCTNQKMNSLNTLKVASDQYYQPPSLISKPYDTLNINLPCTNPINSPESSNFENIPCSVISSSEEPIILKPSPDSTLLPFSQPNESTEKCTNSITSTTLPKISNSAQYFNLIPTQKGCKNSLESTKITPSFENQLSSLFSS